MSEYVQALVELIQVLDKAAYGSNAVASTHRIDDLERRVNNITGTTPGGGGGDPDAVKLVGDQTINGEKTFVEPIIVPENTFPIVAVIGLRSLIDGKAEKTYVDDQDASLGSALSGKADATDPRLSDARAPLGHGHVVAHISDSTATGRAVLTAADTAAARTAIGAVSTTDTRLSDARNPKSHTHVVAEISDSGAAGRALVKAADSAAARTAIGAGTSNVAVVTMTQAAYTALGTKDPNTIYFIQG